MKQRAYLECEKQWVYRVLILVAGFYGGYTMLMRGGVFCNAQTGNLVLFGLALGQGQLAAAARYLIPIGAYLLGSLLSEVLPQPMRRARFVRWDTALTLLAMLIVAAVGFIPASAPHQISQILINFICAMQYNTFRQAEGVSMATTFCTNHVRQVGIALTGLFSRNPKERQKLQRGAVHGGMLLCFILGVAAAAASCALFGVRAIWCALVPLGVLFADLLHADLTKEKHMLEETPAGH